MKQWKCNVEQVDDNVAQLFGHSVRNKQEFPEVESELKGGDKGMIGEALIRPSKTSADIPTLHWLVREG